MSIILFRFIAESVTINQYEIGLNIRSRRPLDLNAGFPQHLRARIIRRVFLRDGADLEKLLIYKYPDDVIDRVIKWWTSAECVAR